MRQEVLDHFGPKAFCEVAGGDGEDLARVYIFGVGAKSQHIGVEPLSAGSLKLFFGGETQLGTFSYSEGSSFANKFLFGVEQVGGVSVAKLREAVLRTMAAETWPAFLQAVPSFRRCHVVSPAVVFVPAGWIVMEKTANNTDVFGMQTSIVPQAPGGAHLDAFRNLVALSDKLPVSSDSAFARQLRIMRAIRAAMSEPEAPPQQSQPALAGGPALVDDMAPADAREVQDSEKEEAAPKQAGANAGAEDKEEEEQEEKGEEEAEKQEDQQKATGGG